MAHVGRCAVVAVTAGVMMLPLTAHAALAPTASAPTVSARRAATGASWSMAGHDLTNDRNNPAETTITASNAGALRKVWSRSFTHYVSATPTVVGSTVYVTDWGGTLWALRTGSGAVRWSHQVSAYTGLTGDYSRVSPAYRNGRLFLGDHPSLVTSPDGAHVMAVNATTGALLWDTVVESNPVAIITGSPAVDGNTVYVGVSSDEEDRTSCCSFRGSVVALDATTGQLLWKTYTAPAGYTGSAVWSSNPVVDHATGLLYVGTGNNYTVPAGVCTQPQQVGCTARDPADFVDSLLALHLSTGAPAWVFNTLDADVSSKVCDSPTTCGPDFDFGSDPNLFTATVGGASRQLLGIGQKSGIYWAVDAATGALVWQTRVGPGGVGGGVEWGSATDGTRIYVAEADSGRVAYQLPSGQTVSGGSIAALDPATGQILWQVADPQGAPDRGFVSTADGVVYAGSDAGAGKNMEALDGATGQLLWSFASRGAVIGGAAIVNGTVYWASGYHYATCPPSQPGCGKVKALYAFRLAP